MLVRVIDSSRSRAHFALRSGSSKAWATGSCWLWLLTHKITTSLAVPLALTLVGGGLQVLMTHQWRLDHFVFGITMAMTTVGMAMAGSIDWIRGALALADGQAPDFLQLIWYFVSFATAATALFLIMFLQIPYHKAYDARKTANQRTIEVWRFLAINGLGGAALFVSLLFLLR
jgi:hypothetical protein